MTSSSSGHGDRVHCDGMYGASTTKVLYLEKKVKTIKDLTAWSATPEEMGRILWQFKWSP